MPPTAAVLELAPATVASLPADVLSSPAAAEINVPDYFQLAVGAKILGGYITDIEIAAGNTFWITVQSSAQNTGSLYSPAADSTASGAGLIYSNNYATTCASNWATSYGTATIKRLRLKQHANAWNVYNWSTTCDTTTSTSVYRLGAGTGNYFSIGGTYAQKTKEEELRDRLRANLRPGIVTRNRNLWGIELTEEEIRARTLLLELIGETAFRRYMRRGFIMVQGRSGTMYKVSGGNVMIVSYVRDAAGKYIPNEKFCVIFNYGNMPFTDGVIMRKLIIENDEFALRKRANVFKISDQEKVELLTRAG